MRDYLVLILAVLILSCGQETTDDPASNSGASLNGPVTSTQGYDEMAASYYELDSRVIWQRPELVMNVLGPLDETTIADIGAGTGYFAFRLAAAGADVIAIDIDPRAIAFMQSEKERYSEEVQQRFTTRLANPTDANLANGEVDVILMVNTYIYIDDRINYFKKLREGLQSNGQLVIIDFKKKKTTIGPDIEDRISLKDVQRELRSAGYVILDVDETTLEYQYMVRAVRQ